jgi:hypothetical protein
MAFLPNVKRKRYKEWRRKKIGILLFVIVCVFNNNIFVVYAKNGTDKSVRNNSLLLDGHDSINSNHGKGRALSRRTLAADSDAAEASQTELEPIEVDTSLPAIPSLLTAEMREIMNRVSQVICDDNVRRRMYNIYSKNGALFEACYKDSGYRFFPSVGVYPNEVEILRLCNSNNCMNLFTGILLANFPECDIDNWSVRTMAEIMFHIRYDLSKKKSIPGTQEFDDLYNLYHVVNLLNENASVFEAIFSSSISISLEDMIRVMNPIQMNEGVAIQNDMIIVMNNTKSIGDEKHTNTKEPREIGKDPINGTIINTKESDEIKKMKSKMHSSIFIVGIIWCSIHLVYYVFTRKKNIQE